MHNLTLKNIAVKQIKAKQVIVFINNKTASMTLESTFIFPLLLALLFIMICIGIVIMNINTHQFIQLTAVERAAFNWDKYDRDFSSGIRKTTYRYGLYEYDTTLMMLNQLFHFNKPITTHQLALQYNTNEIFRGDLKEDKLQQINSYFSRGEYRFAGKVSFELHNFTPRVFIRTTPKALLLNMTYNATTSAVVQDATQHIRGVDLFVYYSEKLHNQIVNKEDWLQNVKNALP